MATKRKISAVALILACQRKVLSTILQNDIKKNKKLFDELARL